MLVKLSFVKHILVVQLRCTGISCNSIVVFSFLLSSNSVTDTLLSTVLYVEVASFMSATNR